MSREELLDKMADAACEACYLLEKDVSGLDRDHFPDVCDCDGGDRDNESILRASLEKLARAPFLTQKAKDELSGAADSLYRDLECEARFEMSGKRFRHEDEYYDAIYDEIWGQIENLDYDDYCATISCLPADEGNGFRMELSLEHGGKILDAHQLFFPDDRIARSGAKEIAEVFADSLKSRLSQGQAQRDAKGPRP